MSTALEVTLFIAHWVASCVLFCTAIVRLRVLTLRDKNNWKPTKLGLCAGWMMVALAAAGGIYAPVLRGMREARGANVEFWVNPQLTVADTAMFIGFALVFAAQGMQAVKKEKEQRKQAQK